MIEQREKRSGVVVKNTTLNKLGIAPPYDPLRFGSDRLDVAHVTNETGHRFVFGLLDHPCLGEHLDQVLRLRAPYKADEGKSDTFSDFNSILRAMQGSLELGDDDEDDYINEVTELHIKGSPITPFFMEFVHNHLERWTKALENDAFDAIFKPLPNLVLLRHTDEFIPQVLSQALHPLAGNDPRDNTDGPFKTRVNYLEGYAVKASPHKEYYAQFLSKQEEMNPLEVEKRVDLLKRYFLLLSKSQQQDFMKGFATYAELNIVDIENRKIWEATPRTKSDIGRRASMRIPIDGTYGVLAISILEGVVKIASTLYDNPSADWQIDFKLDPEYGRNYRPNALLPFLAIKEDPHGRRAFMNQREAIQTATSFGLSVPETSDVALGRVVMALSCSVEDWETEIALHEGGPKQPMLTAQTPVWVSLDYDQHPHARDLLSDKNNFYPRLVQFAETPSLLNRISRRLSSFAGSIL